MSQQENPTLCDDVILFHCLSYFIIFMFPNVSSLNKFVCQINRNATARDHAIPLLRISQFFLFYAL